MGLGRSNVRSDVGLGLELHAKSVDKAFATGTWTGTGTQMVGFATGVDRLADDFIRILCVLYAARSRCQFIDQHA